MAGGRATAGEQAGHVAILAAVYIGNRLFDGVDVEHTQHGAENFHAGNLASRIDVVQEGRPYKSPVFVARNVGGTAVYQHRRPLIGSLLDELLDAELVGLVNHRAHLHRLIQAIPHHAGAGHIGHRLGKCVPCFADGDGQRGGQTALPRTAKGGIGRNAGRHFHVGIGQDDEGVFGAALRLHPLAVLGSLTVNVFGHGGGANEANGPHGRVLE